MAKKLVPEGVTRHGSDRGIRPTWVEINLSALKHNFQVVRDLVGNIAILAVVKANAYGHGAVPIAQALEKWGVAFLGVALVEEGLELRHAGIRTPILVLGGSYDGGYEAMVEHDLTPTVFRAEHLAKLQTAAASVGRTINAHLKIDTGLGRLGLVGAELDGFLVEASRFPAVRLDGVLSHFASADLGDAAVSNRQVEQFVRCSEQIQSRGLQPRWWHISNSASLVKLPKSRTGLFNLVRPGIILYGLEPAKVLRLGVPLQPVLSWKTRVIHLKTVPKGAPVSYGGTWVAPKESLIATMPIGYADGYPRSFSNRSQVLLRGQRARVVGRVCMDLTMVDVTQISKASIGDEVILLGGQESDRITAEELAEWAQTIPYEIVCGVSARVPRVVLQTD